MLDQLGWPTGSPLPDAQEDAEALEMEREGETPEDYVLRVTEKPNGRRRWRGWRLPVNKGGGMPDAPILCADTTVALDNTILGKPRDEAHAAQILSSLSGRNHRVLTAVVVNGHALVSTSRGLAHLGC